MLPTCALQTLLVVVFSDRRLIDSLLRQTPSNVIITSHNLQPDGNPARDSGVGIGQF